MSFEICVMLNFNIGNAVGAPAWVSLCFTLFLLLHFLPCLPLSSTGHLIKTAQRFVSLFLRHI